VGHYFGLAVLEDEALTKLTIKHAVLSVFLLAALPVIGTGAQAQEMFDDFVRYGDYFPEAGFPMSPLEKQLFGDIQVEIEQIQKRGAGTELFMPGATKLSLLSVKISKKGNVLVNLRKRILPRTEFLGDDQFYHQLHMGIVAAAEKRLNVRRSNEPGDMTPPILVYFVFERKTATPGEYQPEDRQRIAQPIRKSQLQPLAADTAVIPGEAWTHCTLIAIPTGDASVPTCLRHRKTLLNAYTSSP
jgi:hypothetical protein